MNSKYWNENIEISPYILNEAEESYNRRSVNDPV